MLLTINTDGTIETLATPEAAELFSDAARVTKRRASHVLPASWLKRQLFKLLRYLTSETGSVSDWTRSWRGPWRVEIVSGPYLGEFENRADAISAEIAWLEAAELAE